MGTERHTHIEDMLTLRKSRESPRWRVVVVTVVTAHLIDACSIFLLDVVITLCSQNTSTVVQYCFGLDH